MYLAKVVGTVVATRKNENLVGIPLYVVRPVDESLEPAGDEEVAIDSVGVGEGEFVWVEGGKEAAYALPRLYGPSDASIVGKVENLDAPIRPPKDVPVPLPEAGKVRRFG
jgi:ethanolamine utilization protein EutN